MELKKVDKLKKYIKLIIAYPDYSKLFKKLKIKQENRAILIGTPIHGNLGDSLIAQQCLIYLKSRYKHVVEIPEFFYEIFSDKIKIYGKDDIYICGGGWMGNMYEDEIVIEHILSKWPQNKKIILPQTISFSVNGKFSSSEKMKSILIKENRTIICVREENSYKICRDDLSLMDDKIILLPDMALLALKGRERRNHRNNKIIFSIRNDIEKCTIDMQIESIRQYLRSKGYECIDSSTVISRKVIGIKKRDRYIMEKIREYSDASLVITDRLHSMVFAVLAGCKCVAIDNSTHKVSGVYKEWLNNVSGVWLLEESTKLSVEFVDKCLKCEEYPQTIDLSGRLAELDKRVEKL